MEDAYEDDFTGSDEWPPAKRLDRLFHNEKPNNHGRRLVLAAASADYADFADNFAHSLLLLNVTNFVLIPLDAVAHRRLRQAHPRHTLPVPLPGLLAPVVDNPDDPERAGFDTPAFKRMTSTRPRLIRAFVERSYTILYNDVDMVWQKNAWDFIDARQQQLQTKATAAAAAATPTAKAAAAANTAATAMFWLDGMDSVICTCLIYMEPTVLNLQMLSEWDAVIVQNTFNENVTNDQSAFGGLVQSRPDYFPPPGGGSSPDHSFVVFPNDEEFPAGNMFPWEYQNSNATGDEQKKWKQHHRNSPNAVIVHNNWIIGKDLKHMRFITARLWKPSNRLPPKEGPQ